MDAAAEQPILRVDDVDVDQLILLNAGLRDDVERRSREIQLGDADNASVHKLNDRRVIGPKMGDVFQRRCDQADILRPKRKFSTAPPL